MLGVVGHRDLFAGMRMPGVDERREWSVAMALQLDTLAAVGKRHIQRLAVGATPQAVIHQRERRLAREFFEQQVTDAPAGQLAGCTLALGLHVRGERQHHPARQVDAEIALEQKRHAPLARLAVHPDHGLVVTADITRVDRQIGHLPVFVLALLAQRLADRILMAAGKRGIDQLTHPGMARMQRNAGAFVDDADDLVGIGQIQLGVDALAIEIHRQDHDIHVAGALAVAQQAAFDTLRTRQYRQLGGRHGTAAIVVRMHGHDHGLAILDVLAEVLDLVGVVMRAGQLHRVRQVEDDSVVGRGLPDIHDRFADAHGKLDLGRGKALRRIFEAPMHARALLRVLLYALGALDGDIDDAVLVHLEHALTLHGRGRVVEMDDRLVHTFQGFEGAIDQVVARLGERCDGHIVRNLVFVDQPAHEVVVRLAGRRKADHDLLDADIDQQLPEPLFLFHRHRFEQRLVAVTQIFADPDGRFLKIAIRPGAVETGHPRGGAILAVVETAHGGPRTGVFSGTSPVADVHQANSLTRRGRQWIAKISPDSRIPQFFANNYAIQSIIIAPHEKRR